MGVCLFLAISLRIACQRLALGQRHLCFALRNGDRGVHQSEPAPQPNPLLETGGDDSPPSRTAAGTAAQPKEDPQNPEAFAKPKGSPPNPAASAKPKEKLAPPDEATQKQALAMIRETYRDDYRAADKAALAKKLVEKADESKSDAVARFALLQEAKKLAAEAFQGELAFEVIDALASEYDVRGPEMKAAVLEQAAKKTRLTPEQRTGIAQPPRR